MTFIFSFVNCNLDLSELIKRVSSKVDLSSVVTDSWIVNLISARRSYSYNTPTNCYYIAITITTNSTVLLVLSINYNYNYSIILV